MNNNYKTTVGIEIHCQLKTNGKMFSPSLNNAKSQANENICEMDLAYPGVLPTINEKAVELALKAALLLNCKINKTMFFDRKNYFYPDLPKGYQITQNQTPIGIDGYVVINTPNGEKKIRIHDIHIEEDTAKSIHHNNKTLLDFNRCGVPLIEIVSEPDIKTPEEAVLYIEKLRELFIYADISDCKIEEGSMRCDVNISVSKDDTLGVRTETKNVSSISNVLEVVKKEALRQIEVLERGGKIEEETRRFDEDSRVTVLMRKKETGNDYRYIPDGDIPALVLRDEYIEEVKNSIPVMPDVRRQIYKNHDIADVNIEKIIANKNVSDYLLKLESVNLKIASNLLLGDIAAYLNANHKNLEDTMLTIEKLKIVVEKLDAKELTNKDFKDIMKYLLESDLSVDEIIKKYISASMSEGELMAIVKNVVDSNQSSVSDYKAGKTNAFKFLMGQIMKASRGAANPKSANDMLVSYLEHV